MRMMKRMQGRARGRRGMALAMIMLMLVGLGTLSAVMLTLTRSAAREIEGARSEVVAFYAAEAALSQARFELANGGTGELGTAQQPVAFGDARMWVAREERGTDRFALIATGEADRDRARVELVLARTVTAMYTVAAFGDEGMTLDSNAMVDSYDSTLGPYGNQEVNGGGSDRYALSNGHVGSNGNIELKQNSVVHGDAHAGPASTTTLLGSAVVSGSTAPSPTTRDMPPIEVPVIAPTGTFAVDGSGSQTLAAGDYHFDAVTVGSNATVTVVGPARIVCDTFTLSSNSEFLVDSTNGPVDIYVAGDFVMSSNTLLASTSWTPADLTIHLESDNVIDPDVDVDVDGNLDDVTFDSNSELYGTIYAPNAAIEIDSNFELFGAIIARSVHLDSNSKVHFDEALLEVAEDEGTVDFQRICWRVLADRG